MTNPLLLAQKLIQFPSVTPQDAGIIPKPTSNQTHGFQDEDAQPILIGEHSRDPQNSCGSLEAGNGIVDFIIEYLTPYGFKCKKIISEDVTNLYARYGDKDPNFCFAGHTDVVPAGKNWSVEPFAGIIENGKLYGRGASDMKAAIAAFMCASIDFITTNHFNGSISFLISGNEEGIPDNGTPKILEYIKSHNHHLSACIVGEPTCPNILGDMIKYGRRGSVTFHLTVEGTQGHVAYPALANNPIDILLKILTALKSSILDEGNEDFDASHLEITDITVGNPTSNVIPGQAQATFNIRFNNLHTATILEKLIENICAKYSKSFALKFKCSAEAFTGSKDSDLIKNLSSAITEITSLSPSLSTTGGTSDARFIKGFCPVAEFGLINQTAHHVDEHVACHDIQNLKAIYLAFLKKYFKCKD